MLNIPLLDQLRQAGGEFLPWAALDARSPQPAADIAALADFGFGIERHPIHGVAYRGPSPRLCPDQIEWQLNTKVIGRQIAVWNRVASTNDLAAQAATSRSNHGLAILAEEQTAGRGSRGRVWTAPPRSSILLSVLLFPPPELADPVWLNALAAYSVAGVVWGWISERWNLTLTTPDDRPTVTIKWPNDIRIHGRKLAGILVERGRGTVIGIGLNANIAPTEFPPELQGIATSLAAELGGPVDRSALVRDLLGNLDILFRCASNLGLAALNGLYNWHSEHVGREVEVATESGIIAGRLGVLDLGRGLRVGPSLLEARTIPIGGFSAIANRPNTRFWTRDERTAWFGATDPDRSTWLALPQANPRPVQTL